jgi:hypothetical protein
MDPWTDIKSAAQNLKKEASKRKGDFRQTIDRLPVIISALVGSLVKFLLSVLIVA